MISYEVKQKTRIEELNAEAVILEHKKTKAKVFLIPCEDNNKVFAIGFRTRPDDSTGVAHIIEHTVLCGSKKYPCKDPFIELAKGSLNTFLNAMTYPDKTVYPVASCNDKDFSNLVSVYLDAVFNPNIYREEKIFKQEGWHYELESENSELIYNGVVYNEMKGVYSTADGVLDRATSEILFSGHTYGEDSGGDPDVIPELTYEKYLEFHEKYYHPSNCYIYLYGDVDMEAMLDKIDKEYLSKYDYKEIDSAIPDVERWNEKKEVEIEYSISDTENAENSAYLSLSTVVGGTLNREKSIALQIIDYLLLGVPGAPLREALINAGIGEDIDGGYVTEIRCPYFSVIAKNARLDQKEEFLKVIHDCLSKIVNNGLDRQSILAAINVFEFRSREADFGSYPKGLVYGLTSFESWLYDAEPTMHLRYEEAFAQLREKADTGYFEQLIKECLLDNTYQAVINLKPVKGLTAARENELREKLASIKASMSPEEIKSIVKQTAELKAYQSEPSSAENLATLPMLSREDIDTKSKTYPFEVRCIDGRECYYSDIFTSKIAYIRMMFDIDDIADEDVPYVALLTEIFGYIDTERHTYAELATLTDLNSGGIGFSLSCYPYIDMNGVKCNFDVNAKVLYDKTGFVFDQIAEMLYESKLYDKKRLKDIVAEVKAKVKESIQYGGHQTALNRAGSHIACDRWFADNTKGVAYYKFLEKLSVDDALCEKLTELARHIFAEGRLSLDFICDEEGYQSCEKAFMNTPAFANVCRAERKVNSSVFSHDTEIKSEVFTTEGMVNYVARFGDYRHTDIEYEGTLAVFRTLLNYDYLWNNIRVLGGAYGCSAIFGMSRNGGFTSFRDPNLTATDEVYKKLPEYAENYEADEREMTKAIIGAIAEMDMPLTPLGKGLKALSGYYQHLTAEGRQKVRDEVLSVTPQKIRNLKPMLEALLENSYVCALATGGKVAENESYWDKITSLVEE